MEEHLTNTIVVIIFVIICLAIFVYIFQLVYGTGSVRKVICGALFWLPFGSIITALTHGCAIVPA
jgi:dolichyl-phosphate-mannose--protein O-mannosyl transferase